jgi:hypothetical protein
MLGVLVAVIAPTTIMSLTKRTNEDMDALLLTRFNDGFQHQTSQSLTSIVFVDINGKLERATSMTLSKRRTERRLGGA